MSDCIFCKIINGEIPSFSLYEDENFKVILDRFPSSLGHTLIISKKHNADIFDLPETHTEAIMPLAKKIASALKEALNCDGINILQNNGEAAGQSIFHYHLHVIPRYKNDNLIPNWETKDPSMEEFQALLSKIKIRP